MKHIRRLAVAALAVACSLPGLSSCVSLANREQPPLLAVTRGERIYEQHCIGCHAQRATGDAFLAVPALAGQQLGYLQNQIARFSSDERHSPQMRWAFKRATMTTPQAATDIAAYLSHLPQQTFAQSDSRFQDEGQVSYATHCAACHGADARGNSDGAIPSLRAQHDSYLVNRLRRFASTSPAVDVSAHRIDDHTIIAVAAYLSSLRGVPLEDAAALR